MSHISDLTKKMAEMRLMVLL